MPVVAGAIETFTALNIVLVVVIVNFYIIVFVGEVLIVLILVDKLIRRHAIQVLIGNLILVGLGTGLVLIA